MIGDVSHNNSQHAHSSLRQLLQYRTGALSDLFPIEKSPHLTSPPFFISKKQWLGSWSPLRARVIFLLLMRPSLGIITTILMHQRYATSISRFGSANDPRALARKLAYDGKTLTEQS